MEELAGGVRVEELVGGVRVEELVGGVRVEELAALKLAFGVVSLGAVL